MEKQEVKSGMSTASLVLGIVAMVFALLPALSVWFVFLQPINYVVIILGVIFGIIALVKKQPMVKSIVGLGLCVLAFLTPIIFLSSLYAAA